MAKRLDTTQNLSPTEFASAVTAISSAFGDPTRRDIYLHVRTHDGGVTAAKIAEQFDLHANVARHHLDKLAAGGYLEVGRTATSGAGRPAKLYSCSDPNISIEFPIRHHDVLITLLGKALSLLSEEKAEQLAEEVGVEYGRTMAKSLSPSDTSYSFRQSLHVIAGALSAHGFSAHAQQFGEDLQIVTEHCPFGDAAVKHPVICAVDRGMVKGMLGSLYGHGTTKLSASLPQGDEVCVTAVDL